MQLFIYFFWQVKVVRQPPWLVRDGNGEEQGRMMGSSPLPSMVLFFPFCPTPYDGENFLTPSLSLGTPPRPVKFYFILICHTIISIFFNKTCFIKTRAKWSGEGWVKAGLGKIAISWLLCATAPDYWIIERNFFLINLLKIKHYNKKNHF